MVGPGIFVGGLATSGWLFTNHMSRKNQIEKNTYDLILTYTKDKFYVDHRTAVWKRFAPYADISNEEISKLVEQYYSQPAYSESEGENAAFSLVQIINFYEYLAIGIKRGVLSENLCKAFFMTTFKNFHSNKSGAFIAALIARDNKRADSSKSVLYSNYIWLYGRWS
jgi:Domain of unknown function (DUF4760)